MPRRDHLSGVGGLALPRQSHLGASGGLGLPRQSHLNGSGGLGLPHQCHLSDFGGLGVPHRCHRSGPGRLGFAALRCYPGVTDRKGHCMTASTTSTLPSIGSIGQKCNQPRDPIATAGGAFIYWLYQAGVRPASRSTRNSLERRTHAFARPVGYRQIWSSFSTSDTMGSSRSGSHSTRTKAAANRIKSMRGA